MHFKGDLYVVIAASARLEVLGLNGPAFVVYRPQESAIEPEPGACTSCPMRMHDTRIWIRPWAEFMGNVVLPDDSEVPRFTRVA